MPDSRSNCQRLPARLPTMGVSFLMPFADPRGPYCVLYSTYSPEDVLLLLLPLSWHGA
jgi:hypothetical protein